MTAVVEYFNEVNFLIPLIRSVVTVVFAIVIFNLILSLIKKGLLKKVRTKKQISNVEIFSRILKYIFFVFVILFAIFSYVGSLTGLGIGIGLFSAALGWALQKPITGIAAWIMVVTRRPFEIGDRIIIGDVRGDVVDISLTHIYLNEIGGTVKGEENSGRVIMVPNSILFEQNITNYTSQNEYILDQVTVTVTYESNLEKAIKIALVAAVKYTKDSMSATNTKPYIRTYFDPSGMNVIVRYYSFAKKIQEVSSDISREIYYQIKKTKSVRIAYPHTEVILRK